MTDYVARTPKNLEGWDNTKKEDSILDKSYLEIINDDLIGSAQCLAQSALKYNSDKDKQDQLLALSNHYQNAHDWLKTRLTQFEEMKTAFILLLIETSYCYFIRNDLNKSELENYKKIKNFLASLTENNEKP